MPKPCFINRAWRKDQLRIENPSFRFRNWLCLERGIGAERHRLTVGFVLSNPVNIKANFFKIKL